MIVGCEHMRWLSPPTMVAPTSCRRRLFGWLFPGLRRGQPKAHELRHFVAIFRIHAEITARFAMPTFRQLAYKPSSPFLQGSN